MCEPIIPEDVDRMCQLDDIRHLIGHPDIPEEYLVREATDEAKKMKKQWQIERARLPKPRHKGEKITGLHCACG